MHDISERLLPHRVREHRRAALVPTLARGVPDHDQLAENVEGGLTPPGQLIAIQPTRVDGRLPTVGPGDIPPEGAGEGQMVERIIAVRR